MSLQTVALIVASSAALHFLAIFLISFRAITCQIKPNLLVFNPETDTLPDAVRSLFNQAGDWAASSGFSTLGYAFDAGTIGTRTRSFVGIFANPRNHDRLMAVGMMADAGKGFQLSGTYFEFETRFADEFCVATNNTTQLGCYSQSPNSINITLPAETYLSRLYQVHRHLVERHATAAPTESRQMGPVDFMTEELLRPMRRLVSEGWYRLNADKGRFEPTVKGAFLIAVRLFWPAIVIRKMLRAMRARRVLQSIARD